MYQSGWGPTHAIKHTAPSGMAAYKEVRLWNGKLLTRRQWLAHELSAPHHAPWEAGDDGELLYAGLAGGGPKEGKYELLTTDELNKQLIAGDIVGIGRPEDFGS